MDVLVIDETEQDGYESREGQVIEGKFSYGGDTVIVGKPLPDDIVRYHDGEYSSIWERIDLNDIFPPESDLE